jgi:hypothetical protein
LLPYHKESAQERQAARDRCWQITFGLMIAALVAIGLFLLWLGS